MVGTTLVIPINYGGVIVIRMVGLRTYRSSELRSNVVTIDVRDSSDLLYGHWSGSVSLQELYPHGFSTYDLQLSSHERGESSNYTFTYTYDEELLDSDYLSIQFPFTLGVECRCYPSCRVSGTTISVDVGDMVGVAVSVQIPNTHSLPTPFISLLST